MSSPVTPAPPIFSSHILENHAISSEEDPLSTLLPSPPLLCGSSDTSPLRASEAPPDSESPDGHPESQAASILSPQLHIGSSTADAEFKAALEEIVHKAELQMQSLFSIHEAMQRELGVMFDRHESATKAAQKLRMMGTSNTSTH